MFSSSLKLFLIRPRIRKYTIFIYTLALWILWSSIIGAATGTTTALFKNLVKLITDHREANPYFLLFLPLGGIIIGYLYKHYGKESTKGNNLIIETIHGTNDTVPVRMGPLVHITSYITHFVGGSTGREAAAVQMGASIAEIVNRIFKKGTINRRILLMCGISAGFGSAFSAPLTGTVFGMEIESAGKMKYEALVPCAVASFVGHFVTQAWGVPHEEHIIQAVPRVDAAAIFKVILASILFAFISAAYCQLRHQIERLSKKYIKDPVLIGAVGGITLLVLILLVGTRDYTGRGLKIVTKAFEEKVSPFAFFWKLVFTSVTMGTGFRGGEAIPLFFMGATLGNTLAPALNLPISFLAGIGLIAAFCGASNAPISCFLLSLEFFKGKGTVFFFIACLVSYIFSGHHSIYPSQKLYEPKSRLFGVASGQTIEALEQKNAD